MANEPANSWQNFLILNICRFYNLTTRQEEILLSKFPNRETVISNNEVADQLVDNDGNTTDPENVRRQLHSIYKQFCPSEDKEGFSNYKDRGGKEKDTAFLTWLNSQYSHWSKTQELQVLHFPTSTSLDNPFSPLTGKIDNQRLFFDRKKEIKEIFELLNINSSIVLIGEEGIGKSSLLEAVCQQARNHLIVPRQAVFLDLNSYKIYDEEDFYRALYEAIGIPEDSRGQKLNRVLRQSTYKWLLAIDNVGKIGREKFSPLRGQLRGFAESIGKPLLLVITAPTNLQDLFQDDGKTSPLSGICLPINLKPWDEITVRALIASRLDSTPIRFTETEIEQIVQESGGQPKKLMQLCYQTYKRYRDAVQ